MISWYYLHENGSLIHKRLEPEDDSPFVIRIWKIDSTDRMTAWLVATEALALGAKKERIFDLKRKWQLTDEDGKIFAHRIGINLSKDGNQWCATFADFVNLQESHAGFGNNVLEAIANLAKPGLQAMYGIDQ